MTQKLTAGQRLIEAAKEAAAIARGESQPAKIYIPADIDVKAIRDSLGLTQEDFASQFGFTGDQVKNWEQGRSRPTGALRAYLMIIHRDPDGIRSLLQQASDAASKAA
jgi:putative transcriptional regulator